MEENKNFEVSLGSFSGPLDLLCHLVESSELDASHVKLVDLVAQYVTYSIAAKNVSLAELAEFFSLATRIILSKVRSLFPNHSDESEEGATDDESVDESMNLTGMIERFHPYRNAAFKLSELKEQRERYFTRSTEDGPLWYDIGDLYGLATLWWGLIERYNLKRESATPGFFDEIPDAVPEEVLVEQRMADIKRELDEKKFLSLSELLTRFQAGALIVTLLALLEMSRLGEISLLQRESWGNVDIAVREGVASI